MPSREQRLAQAEWDAKPAVVKAREAGRCGSRTRHTPPRPCKGSPKPNGRCHRHGGSSTGPPWKHGRYSKDLELFRDILKGRADAPGLLHDVALEKLALFDEAEDALLSRGLSEEDTPEFRQEALKLYKQGKADANEMEIVTPDAWCELGNLLEVGVKHDRVLAEAVGIAGKRLRHTVELRGVMSQEETAAHRLACKLQIVMTEVFAVLVETMGAQRAGPVVDAIHGRLLGGSAKGLVIDVESDGA